MLNTEYHPENDSITITINGESETVDFKEFLDSIPTAIARMEYLLSMIDEVRRQTIDEIGHYMQVIEEIAKKQTKIREMMEELTLREDFAQPKPGQKGLTTIDEKKLLALGKMHKALLDEKNTYREIRYSIKQLNNTEARYKSELLELSLGQ